MEEEEECCEAVTGWVSMGNILQKEGSMMKQNFGLLAEFSLCGRQLANEMGDGAQGRKHIDLLGRSYAEETCKARKA